jgi:hypothetical protein
MVIFFIIIYVLIDMFSETKKRNYEESRLAIKGQAGKLTLNGVLFDRSPTFQVFLGDGLNSLWR